MADKTAQEKLNDQQLLILLQQGETADLERLDDDELSRLHELGESEMRREAQVMASDPARVKRAAPPPPDPFSLKPQSIDSPAGAAILLGGHEPRDGEIPLELMAPRPEMAKAFAISRRSYELDPADPLARPDIPFDAPNRQSRDSLGNLFTADSDVFGVMPTVTEDGHLDTSSMSTWELLWGGPIGAPGSNRAPGSDPTLGGFMNDVKPPKWSDLMAWRMEKLKQFVPFALRSMGAAAEALQEFPHEVLQGRSPVSTAITNTVASLGSIGGYKPDIVEVPIPGSRGQDTMPVWIPHTISGAWYKMQQSSPGRTGMLFPGDAEHPIERNIAWPLRWASALGTFATPSDPRIPDYWGANARLAAVGDAALRAVHGIASTIDPSLKNPLVQSAIRLAEKVEGMPLGDFVDLFGTAMVDGTLLDMTAFQDDEQRARMWRDHPEIAIEQMLAGLYPLSKGGKLITGVPNSVKLLSWRTPQMITDHARGGTLALQHRINLIEADAFSLKTAKAARKAARKADADAPLPAIEANPVDAIADARSRSARQVAEDVRWQVAQRPIEERAALNLDVETVSKKLLEEVGNQVTDSTATAALARRVIAGDRSLEPGYIAEVNAAVDRIEEQAQDVAELLLRMDETDPRYAQLSDVLTRLREQPARIRQVQRAVDDSLAQPSEVAELIDREIVESAKRLLEDPGLHPESSSRMQRLMDKLAAGDVEQKRLARELMEETAKWKEVSSVGKYLPATAGLGMLARWYLGDDMMEDQDHALAAGGLLMLSVIPGMPGKAAVSQVFKSATPNLGQGASLIWAAGTRVRSAAEEFTGLRVAVDAADDVPGRHIVDMPVDELASMTSPRAMKRAKENSSTVASSLKKEGLRERVVVYEDATGARKLIDGHRRVAAAQALGKDTVEARVFKGKAPAGTIRSDQFKKSLQRLDSGSDSVLPGKAEEIIPKEYRKPISFEGGIDGPEFMRRFESLDQETGEYIAELRRLSKHKDSEIADAARRLLDPTDSRGLYQRSIAKHDAIMTGMGRGTGNWSMQQMLENIEKGEPFWQWYHRARTETIKVFGHDTADFIYQMVSATTYNATPLHNFDTAMRILQDVRRAGGIDRVRGKIQAGIDDILKNESALVDSILSDPDKKLPAKLSETYVKRIKLKSDTSLTSVLERANEQGFDPRRQVAAEIYKRRHLGTDALPLRVRGVQDGVYTGAKVSGSDPSDADVIYEILRGERSYGKMVWVATDDSTMVFDSAEAAERSGRPARRKFQPGNLGSNKTQQFYAANFLDDPDAVVLDQVFAKLLGFYSVATKKLKVKDKTGSVKGFVMPGNVVPKDSFGDAQYPALMEMFKRAVDDFNSREMWKVGDQPLPGPVSYRDAQAMLWYAAKLQENSLYHGSEGFAKLLHKRYKELPSHAWTSQAMADKPSNTSAVIAEQSALLAEVISDAQPTTVLHPGTGRIIGPSPFVAVRLFQSKATKGLSPYEIFEKAPTAEEIGRFMEANTELLLDQSTSVAVESLPDKSYRMSVVATVAKPTNLTSVESRHNIERILAAGRLPNGSKIPGDATSLERFTEYVANRIGLRGEELRLAANLGVVDPLTGKKVPANRPKGRFAAMRKALVKAGADKQLLADFDGYISDVDSHQEFWLAIHELQSHLKDSSVIDLEAGRHVVAKGIDDQVLGTIELDALSSVYGPEHTRLTRAGSQTSPQRAFSAGSAFRRAELGSPFDNTGVTEDVLSGVRRELTMEEVAETAARRQRGEIDGEAIQILGASALGGAIGAWLESRRDTDAHFIPTAAFIGTAAAFGFVRALRTPAVRDALFDFASVGHAPGAIGRSGRSLRALAETVSGDARLLAGPTRASQAGESLLGVVTGRESALARSLPTGEAGDLEAVFREVLLRFLPEDLHVTGKSMSIASKATGATAGAALFGGLAAQSEEGSSPSFAKVAAAMLVGGFLGHTTAAAVGNRLFRKDWSPRSSMMRLFMSDAGQPAEFVARKRQFIDELSGRIKEIKDTSDQLYALGPQLGRGVDEFLRGKIGIDQLADEAIAPAVRARMIFDDLALDMVELGIAEGAVKTTILTNLGTYVPRLYLKHEMAESTRLANALAEWGRVTQSSTWKMGDLDGLRERKDLPETVRAALGEINDNPAYLLAKRGVQTAHDVEHLRMLNWIASSEHTLDDLLLKTKVTNAEAFQFADTMGLPKPDPMHPMAYARSKGWRHPKSPEEKGLLEERVKEDLKDLKEEVLRHARIGPDGEARDPARLHSDRGKQFAIHNGKVYMRMPADKKYGPLAGKFVAKDLALDQILKADVPENVFELLSAVGTGVFKTGKVLWNPSTLSRNLISNMILLDQAGISPVWKSGRSAYVDAFKAMPLPGKRAEGQLFIEARRGGLFGGEFKAAEIAELLKGIQDPKLRGASAAGLLLRRVREIGGKSNPLVGMENFHEASEQLSKMIAFAHARADGKSVRDSVMFAKKWIFDYREVPEWVNITRKSVFGAPFITFSYKSIPRVLENALAFGDPKKAAKFWKWPVMFGAANEYSARVFGHEEVSEKGFIPTLKRVVKSGLGMGDEHGFRKWLPNYAGPSQILFPYVDTHGRQMSFDATWFMPWGDLGEFGQGTMGRNLARAGIAFPRWLEPGNPWLHSGIAAMTGKDAFTGRDVMSPQATPMESASDMTRYFLRLWGPQLINPAGRSYEKIRRSLSGDFMDPNTPTPGVAFGSEIGGLKTRSFDKNEAFARAMDERDAMLGKIDGEINWLMRIGADPREIKRKRLAAQNLINSYANKYGLEPPVRNEELQAVQIKLMEERVKGYADLHSDPDIFGLGANVFPAGTPDRLLPRGATRAEKSSLGDRILSAISGGGE